MNIIFFSHPDFIKHQSMPRFAKMLFEGMKNRGHQVEIWSPTGRAIHLAKVNMLKKWLGYLDQYLLFPFEIKRKLKHVPTNTLFVFTDHALGPWVPLVANRPHIIHCHDFIAQRAAIGDYYEDPLKWSGKQYQQMIRKGYSKGKNFVSVSQKTKNDLHEFLPAIPEISEVVYNGMNGKYTVQNQTQMREIMVKTTDLYLEMGYILHIGGNQWYKNRIGVIEIYDAWRSKYETNLPLLLIGEDPSESLKTRQKQSRYHTGIHFIAGASDELVQTAYSGASVLLFPSLAEGFGWPIAEAMASGCPVITTQQAPMTEVADNAGIYIPKRPSSRDQLDQWSSICAETLQTTLNLPTESLKNLIENGISNAKRFDTRKSLDAIEEIYEKVVTVNS